MNTTKFFIEMTDTFGGEANYCWVNRFTVDAKDARQALTKVKKHVYHSPSKMRHTVSDYGDMLRADMNGANVVFFVTEYSDDDLYTNTVEI